MKQNRSFVRKIVYVAVIAVLLFPLYLLSNPASKSKTGDSRAGEEQAGGKLAQLRKENGLSPANLGEIDPASESMKLATLGLRGVAASMLWSQANDYKKKKNWDKLSATLEQISKLQPNFANVWEFQAHNLSYNVSVEFDNFEHRYEWVKKGIKFLMRGTDQNRTNPRLMWYTGWIVGQKIGRADEYRQFRRLFKEDEDFHDVLLRFVNLENLPKGLFDIDNWLVSYLWFDKAEEFVRNNPNKSSRMSAVVFFSESAKALINFADALSEELRPEIDGITQRAWQLATQHWLKFGEERIKTSWGDRIRLNDLEKKQAEIDRLVQKLDDELAPGVRDSIIAERRKDMERDNPEMYAALLADERSLDFASLTPEQRELALTAEKTLEVDDADVADAAPESTRREAKRLSAQLTSERAQLQHIESYRDVVNFDYWLQRARAEQSDEIIQARQAIYDAIRLAEEGKLMPFAKLDPETNVPVQRKDANGQMQTVMLDGAVQRYEDAWRNWAIVLENPEFDELVEGIEAEELINHVAEYRHILGTLSIPELPIDFELLDFLTPDRTSSVGINSKAQVISFHLDGPTKLQDAAKELSQEKLFKRHVRKDKDGKPVQKVVRGEPQIDEQGNPIYVEDDGAIETYEKAFKEWAELFAKREELREHSRTIELVAAIKDYRDMLSELGYEEIPVDFPLLQFLDAHAKEDQLPTSDQVKKADVRIDNNDIEMIVTHHTRNRQRRPVKLTRRTTTRIHR